MLFKQRPDLLSHIVVGPFCAAAGGLAHALLQPSLLTIASMPQWLALIVSMPQWVAGLIALLLATGGKELFWDGWLKKGTPAWDDFAFGLVSGGVVVLAMALGAA